MAAMEASQVLVHRREQAHHGIDTATAGTRVPIRPVLRAARRRRNCVGHKPPPIRTTGIARAATTAKIGSAMSHLRRRRRSCAAPLATHAAQRSSEPPIDGGITGEMSVDMRPSPGKSFGEGCRNGGAQKSRSTDHTRSRGHRRIFRSPCAFLASMERSWQFRIAAPVSSRLPAFLGMGSTLASLTDDPAIVRET